MPEPSDPVKSPSDPRQRLLEAAEAVFAEQGYDGASVRDICGRAGMNIAAISYHFGDKEKLYVEALKAAHECADDGADGPFPAWSATTSAVQKLRDFIRVMAGRMHAPARPSALRLLMREMASPSPAAAHVIREYIQPKAHKLRDILDELLPGEDPRRVLMVGFSVMGQILFYRQNRAVVELMFGKEAIDALGVDLVTDHVTKFTLAALGVEKSTFSGGPKGRR